MMGAGRFSASVSVSVASGSSWVIVTRARFETTMYTLPPFVRIRISVSPPLALRFLEDSGTVDIYVRANRNETYRHDHCPVLLYLLLQCISSVA